MTHPKSFSVARNIPYRKMNAAILIENVIGSQSTNVNAEELELFPQFSDFYPPLSLHLLSLCRKLDFWLIRAFTSPLPL